MIVYLQGTLHQIESDHVILLNQGVGYQVFAPRSTLEQLPPLGEPLELHIHSVFREDSHQLFGFLKPSERDLFLKLIQVNSVGPKLALTILSGLPAQELAEAIGREDLVRLTAIPGIGKKTAERLILDLKDKIIALFAVPPGETPAELLPQTSSDEAISALTNLGYSRHEAQQALGKVPGARELSLEVLVREGLKALS